MKVSKGDKLPEVAPDHPDWPLGSMLPMEALGTVSIDFLQGPCSSWPMPARRVVKSTRLDLILLRSLAQRSVLNGWVVSAVWDAASQAAAKSPSHIAMS